MELILLIKNMLYKKFKTALLVTSVTLLFGLILRTPIRKLIRPLLPKPGEGPSEETMKNGFDSFFTAELDNGDKNYFVFMVKVIQDIELPLNLFAKVR